MLFSNLRYLSGSGQTTGMYNHGQCTDNPETTGKWKTECAFQESRVCASLVELFMSSRSVAAGQEHVMAGATNGEQKLLVS